MVFGLPFAAACYLHFFYVSGYTFSTFDRSSFLRVYAHEHFRYRVLGRWLVLAVNDALAPLGLDARTRSTGIMTALERLQAGFSLQLYLSYFIVDTVGLIAFSVLLWRLLRRCPPAEAVSAYLLGLLPVLLSLYVVTPYDTTAYALLLASVVSFHSTSRRARAGLVLAVALGAITRETASLAIPYFAVVAWFGAPELRRERIVRAGAGALSFVVHYFGLRMLLGSDSDRIFTGGSMLGYTMSSPRNLLGLLLAVLLSFVVSAAVQPAPSIAPSRRRRALVALYAGLTPYIGVTLVTGMWAELRLAVPLILLHLVMVKIGLASTT